MCRHFTPVNPMSALIRMKYNVGLDSLMSGVILEGNKKNQTEL